MLVISLTFRMNCEATAVVVRASIKRVVFHSRFCVSSLTAESAVNVKCSEHEVRVVKG